MNQVNKVLRQEIKENMGSLCLIGMFMMGMVAFDVISPWPFKILIDNVLAPGASPLDARGMFSFLEPIFSSRYLLGFFAVLIYFSSTFLLEITTYLRESVTKKVIKSITADFSKKAFKNLESLAIGFYKKQKIGDYVYRLGYDVSEIGAFLESGILPLITSGLYLVITLIIMMVIDFKLALISLITLPFLAFCLRAFNKYITHATKKSEFFNSAAFSFIEEALTHLKIIQAFSQESRESKRFSRKTETSLKSDAALFRLDFLATLLFGIIIALTYSVVILYGIQAVFSGTLTTGLLIVFIFYLDNLTLPILSIVDATVAARESHLKISRMEDFFSKKTHLNYHLGKMKTIKDTTIRFDRVTLKGDRHGHHILDEVSFTIESGKRTVIMGANGSGKTSIINLILRFIEQPTSGTIYLGGVDIRNYDITSLRESIAFVPQEISLFNESIRNNIAFGNHERSFRDIKEAARLADADSFISRLPDGYDFKVGELGEFLSGGQRQRLMLARALMKQEGRIWLFDETLSALDVRARKTILEHLYDLSKNKTMILVSNIFDVVTAADQVIVLNKGKLVYNGSSRQLPKETALYKIIVDSE